MLKPGCIGSGRAQTPPEVEIYVAALPAAWFVLAGGRGHLEHPLVALGAKRWSRPANSGCFSTRGLNEGPRGRRRRPESNLINYNLSAD